MTVRHYAAMLLVLMAVACGGNGDDDGGNPTGPSGSGLGSDPAITNNTDDFQWELSGASNFSTNGGYTWRNTGTQARVTINNNLSAGGGTITVRDAGGRVVFTGSYGNNGTFNSETGPTGDWRVELAPSGASGSINLRVQKN